MFVMFNFNLLFDYNLIHYYFINICVLLFYLKESLIIQT